MAYWNGKFQWVSNDLFKGQYVLLFFYPADFTFVCPTEICEFSDKADKFAEVGCQVIACSTDTHHSHKEYAKKQRNKGGIAPVKIPMIADRTTMISKRYGCLKEDEGVAYRATYLINGEGNLRYMQVSDN